MGHWRCINGQLLGGQRNNVLGGCDNSQTARSCVQCQSDVVKSGAGQTQPAPGRIKLLQSDLSVAPRYHFSCLASGRGPGVSHYRSCALPSRHPQAPVDSRAQPFGGVHRSLAAYVAADACRTQGRKFSREVLLPDAPEHLHRWEQDLVPAPPLRENPERVQTTVRDPLEDVKPALIVERPVHQVDPLSDSRVVRACSAPDRGDAPKLALHYQTAPSIRTVRHPCPP